MYSFETGALTWWVSVQSTSCLWRRWIMTKCWNNCLHAMRKFPFKSTFLHAHKHWKLTQWIILPNNLIFMGLHFVIGKRMSSYIILFVIKDTESISPCSICQFIACHVSGGIHANFRERTLSISRLNSREDTRNKIRRGRSSGSGDHGAVHVIDPRRQKVRDSDEIVVNSGSNYYN